MQKSRLSFSFSSEFRNHCSYRCERRNMQESCFIKSRLETSCLMSLWRSVKRLLKTYQVNVHNLLNHSTVKPQLPCSSTYQLFPFFFNHYPIWWEKWLITITSSSLSLLCTFSLFLDLSSLSLPVFIHLFNFTWNHATVESFIYLELFRGRKDNAELQPPCHKYCDLFSPGSDPSWNMVCPPECI